MATTYKTRIYATPAGWVEAGNSDELLRDSVGRSIPVTADRITGRYHCRRHNCLIDSCDQAGRLAECALGAKKKSAEVL